MATFVNIEIDDHAGIEAILQRFRGWGSNYDMKFAINNALRRAIQHGRTLATRKIRDSYFVKYGAVLKAFKIFYPTYSATSLVATLLSQGQAIPMIKFSVKPNKPTKRKPAKGVLVQVRKDSQASRIDGTFIAPLHGAGARYGVMKRTGPSSLPIEELYGPAVPSMFGSPHVIDDVEKGVLKMFESQLDTITTALEKEWIDPNRDQKQFQPGHRRSFHE